MVEYLEKAARSLVLAERYEMLGEIYKLVIPIYKGHPSYRARFKMLINNKYY
jgi:hypothetical protein